MTQRFTVIIPARFASTRLPGKPLLMIGQKTLIEHVYNSACNSKAAKVIIATDDERIDDVARSFGASVIMTSPDHQSGTDRINEAAVRMRLADDEIIVNLQSDEFGMNAVMIDLAANTLNHSGRQMATLCAPVIHKQDYIDPNTVKVVVDKNKRAVYFSRAPIPWTGREHEKFISGSEERIFRHIGIYAYRAGFLRVFSALSRCVLEQLESLEQLRALYHGYEIHVEKTAGEHGIEINTGQDLARARQSVA